MANRKLTLRYKPHERQREFHDSPARTKVLEVARRGGKTRSVIYELVKAYRDVLEMKRGSEFPFGFRAWVVVPDIPQGRTPWIELLRLLPPEMLKAPKFSDDFVYLYPSENWYHPVAMIEMKSAYKSETLQGAGLDFLWVMEAQDISNEAANRFLPTSISPGSLGRIVYEGIPATSNEHWFAKAFDKAKRVMQEDGPDNKIQSAFKWTYLDNPLLTQAQKREVEDLQDVMPSVSWRRMWLAERTSGGQVFPNLEACIAGDLLQDPIAGRTYVAGCDLGASIDFTEMWVMDAADRKVVAYQQWDSSSRWPQRREEIFAMARHWGVTRLPFDATSQGGLMAMDEFMQTDIPFEAVTFTQDIRASLLNGLIVATERETIQFPHVAHFIRQMRNFEERVVKTTYGVRTRLDHPPGEHDDAIMSVAMALSVCDEAPPVVAAAKGSGAGKRYYPFVSNGGPVGSGARMHRDAHVEALRKRMELAGIDA